MYSTELIEELAKTLKIKLEFSKHDSCGVFFDQDEICFERNNKQLYLIAVLGDASNRADAYQRLLAADFLGAQSGQAVISLDSQRDEFVLHRVIDGSIEFADFENILTDFVKATRYWKQWLHENNASSGSSGIAPALKGVMI
ncbi:MAG: type III secretion system chaperone [Succinivibrio sp.]|nr:type III secretion system chaperone [Succinivibrio sp.]